MNKYFFLVLVSALHIHITPAESPSFAASESVSSRLRRLGFDPSNFSVTQSQVSSGSTVALISGDALSATTVTDQTLDEELVTGLITQRLHSSEQWKKRAEGRENRRLGFTTLGGLAVGALTLWVTTWIAKKTPQPVQYVAKAGGVVVSAGTAAFTAGTVHKQFAPTIYTRRDAVETKLSALLHMDRNASEAYSSAIQEEEHGMPYNTAVQQLKTLPAAELAQAREAAALDILRQTQKARS